MKDLSEYVPKKLEPYFEEAFRDPDGIWFYFTENVRFMSTDCGIVHEDTITQCREVMRDYILYPDAKLNAGGWRISNE